MGEIFGWLYLSYPSAYYRLDAGVHQGAVGVIEPPSQGADVGGGMHSLLWLLSPGGAATRVSYSGFSDDCHNVERCGC